jgi:hypothetical protein
MLPLAQFVAREVARYPASGSRRPSEAPPEEAPAGPGLFARLRGLTAPRPAPARRAPRARV